MKILNYGSLNLDHVYRVDHFVKPGETISSREYNRYCGGKGLNQSIALARAGTDVFHAGKTGSDGLALIDMLKENRVNTEFIRVTQGVSGHAVIQVNKEGDNCIILFGGANREIQHEEILSVLDNFGDGDYILLQNEINSIEYIMSEAKKRNMKIVFNPAPMDQAVTEYPLDAVDIFIINEIEGGDLTGEQEPERILAMMRQRFPQAATALTLGPKGVMYADKHNSYHIPADTTVEAVDTTAAGDTFIGYFLCGISSGTRVEDSLKTACRACDICVARKGAASSIPYRDEVYL